MNNQPSPQPGAAYEQHGQTIYGAQINIAGDQHIHLLSSQLVEDFQAVRQGYFTYLSHLYANHVIHGFSPRISGRDVSLPLAKIFLPLKAIEGRPILAEYAEEDLMRLSLGPMGELDWQRHSMEMEKRSTQMNVKLSAQKPLSLAELLASPRAILLGDPGTGKTTVTRYITYALAVQDYTHTGNAVSGLTPILVRLATYARVYEDNSALHLIEYIEKSHTERPEFGRYLRQAVENGHCLIILDGLDEVTDPALRLRVTENIQSMVASYSHNRFLVTSRIVGYDRSPLTREFKHATLSELETKDRERFVRLWFDALNAEVENATAGEAVKSLTQIFHDKPQISRLAANPLLLTIMILMYWRGVKLPNRRVQIYENATDTLIEYWTTHRGVDLDAHEIKSILAPVAHFILSSNVGGVITRHDLLPQFFEGIVQQRGCNGNEAHRLGRNLLKELGEQSGIFLERGLDANGNPVYGFLHQTFGEYLAGLRLAEEVLGGTFAIQNYIHRSVWHEPILLAAGHLSLVSQLHLSDFLRAILDYSCPFEPELHRNLLLAVDCMTEDIQLNPQLRREVIERLIGLLFHEAQQLREAAVERVRKLTATRHKEAIVEAIKAHLSTINDIDSISAKARYSVAHALVHLGEAEVAKPYLFPLDHERHREKVRIDKVQYLRIEGWPNEADTYLYELYTDKEKTFYLRAEPDLSDFILGPADARTVRTLLGVQRMLALVNQLLTNAHNEEDKATFQFLATIVPEPVDVNALQSLIAKDNSPHVRCLAAIRLLESEHRAIAIDVLQEMVATEPNQAPRAARAIIRIQQHHDLDWSLLRDCAFIGDDDNCTEAILALFDGSQHEIALPAALNLLALYPANTVSRREVRLWPVVEALLTYGFTGIGVAAARWLALRPGYSYRLQAIDALLQAGRVEDATPLYQYLAYECHDETSHEAARKLLLLKELERITPLLAGSVHSDVPESKYQACLGLALATHLTGDYRDLAKPRWELKVSILEERMIAIESALEHFYAVGLKLLEQIEQSSEHRHFMSIATISLNLLPARLMRNFTETIVLDLLGDDVYPVIRLNAARFMLCLGNLDVAYRHLTDLSQMPEKVTLPVYCKALELIARVDKPQTLEVMLQALDSAKEEVRRIAARALGLIGNSQAVRPLLSLLTDKDQNTRRFAVRSLGLLGDSQAIPMIIETLSNDKDEFTRGAAAYTLAQLADPQAVNTLQRAYNDPHNWVRRAVIDALGDLKLADCIPLLLHGLNDKNGSVRGLAVFELGHFEPPQLREYKVIPQLIDTLKHDEEPIARFYAAQSLGLIGDSNAVQPLLNSLDENDGLTLGGILWALNRFYFTNDVKQFVQSMKESTESTLPLAVNFLLRLLDDKALITKLMEAICSDNNETRTAVGYILRSCGEMNLLHVLLASLTDEDLSVRQSLVYALDNYQTPKLQRYLLHLLSDEYVSTEVLNVLARTNDRSLYRTLLTAWWINIQSDPADLLDAIAKVGLTEATSFCESIAIADTPYEGQQVARALIHLKSTAAFATIDRFERQFRHTSDFKMLRGQAHWALGRSDLAITCFHQALEQEEKMDNYLAVVHYYIEHQQMLLAQEYLNRAFDKARNYREDCFLTQAVLYWLTNKAEASLATFGNTHPRSRTKHYIDELEFADFWRATALTALREIHDRYTTQEVEVRP